MTVAGCVGLGALRRRPDGFTKLHLRFNGTGSVFTDDAGMSCTATNATQTETNARFIGKCYASALSMNGVAVTPKSQLDFLHQLGQNETSDKWSISFWYRFKYGYPPTNNCIFDNLGNNTSQNGIDIWFRGGTSYKRMYVEVGNGSGVSFTVGGYTLTGSIPDDSLWHYVVITCDLSLASANLNIYLDGVLIKSIDKSAQTPSTATARYTPKAGSWANSASNFLDGNIHDFCIRTGVCIDGTRVPKRRI